MMTRKTKNQELRVPKHVGKLLVEYYYDLSFYLKKDYKNKRQTGQQEQNGDSIYLNLSIVHSISYIDHYSFENSNRVFGAFEY